MSLVLDCSVTAAWVFVDETTEEVGQIFERVCEQGGWVPLLWRPEVANVLEMGVRRGRCGRGFVVDTLTDLEKLPITEDGDTSRHAWSSTLDLAARHQLTVYDAAYLELAIRRSLPLASIDKELRAAAERERVTLLAV